MSDHEATPVLTVVVVMLGGPSHLRRWLHAMNAQEDAPPTEILIPYDGRYGEQAVADIPLRNARVLRLDHPGSYAQLRSLGVRNARGQYIMITEDHCVPRPDWLRAECCPATGRFPWARDPRCSPGAPSGNRRRSIGKTNLRVSIINLPGDLFEANL